MNDTYVDIENPLLRAYNRATNCINLLEKRGEEGVKDYFKQFNEKDQAAIYTIMYGIKTKGSEEMKRLVLNKVGETL